VLTSFKKGAASQTTKMAPTSGGERKSSGGTTGRSLSLGVRKWKESGERGRSAKGARPSKVHAPCFGKISTVFKYVFLIMLVLRHSCQRVSCEGNGEGGPELPLSVA
jgi:hypothetical protein